MKFLTLLFCLLIGVVLGQTNAQDEITQSNEEVTPPLMDHTYVPPIRSTTPPTTKGNCGSNSLGDYKGGCDESVPVIVMPKGRPIMERVLEWFKCGTPACLKKK